MKGVLDFLEKAGLVRNDPKVGATAADNMQEQGEQVTSWLPPIVRRNTQSARDVAENARSPIIATGSDLVPATGVPSAGAANSSQATEGIRLEEIYANEGVPASVYPAERLLRLVDGLSAMDDATRNLAISAMDAADESWTIADPLADARVKVEALKLHSHRLHTELQQVEADTQARLQVSTAKQEEAVNTIRKQITDMEALLARETARGAQENAAQQASLQSLRDQTARQLAVIETATQRLQSLSVEFSSLSAATQD